VITILDFGLWIDKMGISDCFNWLKKIQGLNLVFLFSGNMFLDKIIKAQF